MSDGNGRLTGVIKWFNAKKAFGFIELPEGGMDIFVHATQLRKSGILRHLEEGEKVTFLVETGPKGRFATAISLLEGNPNA